MKNLKNYSSEQLAKYISLAKQYRKRILDEDELSLKEGDLFWGVVILDGSLNEVNPLYVPIGNVPDYVSIVELVMELSKRKAGQKNVDRKNDRRRVV